MSTELIMLLNFAQRNYKQIVSADIDGTWYLFRTTDEKTAVMYGQEAEVGWLQFAPLDSDIYEEWLEMFLETK